MRLLVDDNASDESSVASGATGTCSKRRIWLWGTLVSAVVVVSIVNYFEVSEILASFKLTTSTSNNSTTTISNFKFIHHRIDERAGATMIQRLPSPFRWPTRKKSQEECLYASDYGLIERLVNSSQSYCSGDNDGSPYTFYHAAGLRSTKLENFTVDLRGAEVARDISNLADDGGGHDPRFKFMKNSSMCSCSEPQDEKHNAPNIWKDFLVGGPNDVYCVGENVVKSDNGSVLFYDKEVVSVERAIVLVRKDDHNPFFQISTILNAWIMMQVVGWGRSSTQLVTLDRALPTPVDELRHAVLAPERPMIGGEIFQSRVVHFESALLSPYETSGPIMGHLDDYQPCFANALISDFRQLAIKSMGLLKSKSDPRRCLITVISRRPYGGRRIQRVWQNEGEVLHLMREDYKDAYQYGECEFQSLDFVNMTISEQMQIILDSDVVIGMHGAGMVNVMWARPGTLVVEIFPRSRRRWGYRNLCQYLGCNWHEFRKGRDIRVHTSDPNDQDKHIPYIQWKSFFDPLFRDVVSKLENKTGNI